MWNRLCFLLFCYVTQAVAERNDDNKPVIQFDEAWLSINSTVLFSTSIFYINTECFKCPYVLWGKAPGLTTTTLVVNTTFPTRLKLQRNLPNGVLETFCEFEEKFQENGDYWLFLNFSSYTSERCDIQLNNDPLPAEMPILFVFAGLIGLAILVKVVGYCYRQRTRTRSADITDPSQRSKHDLHVTSMKTVTKTAPDSYGAVEMDIRPPLYTGEAVKEKPRKQRLKSLDTFRGLSLVIMVFVNYGGGGYWFFDHPPWNGLTVADLVFPWFIFIMGTAMNFSFRGMLKRGKSRIRIFFKILKRSILLFAIGIILNTNWGPVDLESIRIPGVLQRFSLTYLVIALMELVFTRKADSHQESCFAPIRDIVLYLHEWVVALGILIAYVCITVFVPVPGCPTGYIGAGGLSEGGAHYNCTGGVASYIDRMVLGSEHIYNHPTPQRIYQTTTAHDPEGILGTLTSIFLCFLGVQSGRIIITYPKHSSRIARWIIWATVTGGIGALLCKASQNDGWVPLNKNLWSVSFILVTASFAFIVLSFLYIIIDILHWWDGDPFVYPGMNSIVVYCCHDVFYRFFPVNWGMESPQHWELLLKAIWDTAIWVVLAYILYRKKIFVAL
ncbi:heparan-alpha-glucosaminide N-acetyltransferase-like [Mizuhopecten yessoensis]|uniref:Heparan-alpha-glucosaminide N-acetyltransferase n=1 Tax=Mizuhopecten yessoensis TaxID=6573 RepID=A0A210QTX7_MIZYE|nr:heparan-alpha-glucosaminide N-acetyltransferase-like [Mizuhopecten yessoensis]OWF52223.1 Heparan-alpha-glucosaminide N-acetyltransferase [Mizuhopecten yessoensis]